jgi:hypothetical protein
LHSRPVQLFLTLLCLIMIGVIAGVALEWVILNADSLNTKSYGTVW